MKTSRLQIQQWLARIPVFGTLPGMELDRLAHSTTELHVPRGQLVFERGDPCLGIHILVTGRVKLMFVSPAGQEKVVRLIGPGDSFGEALLFMGKPYIVSAQTLADSVLLHVEAEPLFNQIDTRPGFARAMLASLSQRLYSLMSDIEANLLRSGTQRVVAYLLRGVDEAQDEAGVQTFRLDTSKTLIASRLNLTPEHFSRILRHLVEQGLLRVRGREITLLDVSALRQYAARSSEAA